MTHDEFIAKWNGKLNDFDGAYWWQCVDLARQYCQDVLWVPSGRFGGSAQKWWENASGTFNDKYEKVLVWSKFQTGDICFFTHNQPIGHVGIVNSDDGGSKVSVFDQNTGSGNGDWTGNNICRIHDYPRAKFHWVWRLKSHNPTPTTSTPTITQPTQELSPIAKRWTELADAPWFVKWFGDYQDTRPVTGWEMRMFLDVDRYNFRNKK